MTKMTMSRAEWLAHLNAHGRTTRSPEDQAAVDELFPNVDPGVKPLGQRVLVQLRLTRTMTNSGIALSHETQDTERWNECVARRGYCLPRRRTGGTAGPFP